MRSVVQLQMSCIALALAAPSEAFDSWAASCFCCISSTPEAITAASRTLLFSSFSASVRGPNARGSPIDPRAYAACSRNSPIAILQGYDKRIHAFLSLMFPRAAAAFARTVPSVSLSARIKGLLLDLFLRLGMIIRLAPPQSLGGY